MTSIIPTKYTDKSGSVDTEIINDFETLQLTIEGTKFASKNFDDFVPVDSKAVPSRFKLNHFKELTDCTISCEIPVKISSKNQEIPGNLVVDIHLDSSAKNYNTYSEFRIVINGSSINIGKAQHFESAFDILKSKLPDNEYVKCCYNCLYSDYSVYGSAIFGTMLCFKNIKEQYLNVQDKDEYMDIMDLHNRLVQETYLCDDFKLRRKDTGYRG